MLYLVCNSKQALKCASVKNMTYMRYDHHHQHHYVPDDDADVGEADDDKGEDEDSRNEHIFLSRIKTP